MAFDEIRFPESISYNSQRGPEYVTTIYENETHVEHRIGRTPVGRLRYIVSKDLLTISDIKELEIFFRGRKGRLYGFRYKDWEDYSVSDEGIDTSGGTTAQLIKTYTDTLRQEVRTITKPVTGTVSLKKEGDPWPASGNWSLDYTTGILTFTSDQSASMITWSGEFDVPVRFASDQMLWTRESFNIHVWDSIELVELIY